MAKDLRWGGERQPSQNALKRSRKRRQQQHTLAEAQALLGHGRNDPRPELRLIDVPLGKLHEAGRRLHKSDEAHVLELMASIQEFGVSRPILIQPDRTIIDGHTVVEAARRLRLDDLPCIVVDHLTDNQLRLFKIAVNRLAEKAQWDFSALKVEFEELIELGAPVQASGFSLPVIDELLREEEDRSEPEVGPLEPEPRAPAITMQGDLWRLGSHRLLCANALDSSAYDRLLGGTAVRFVLTDMPYNLRIRGNVTRGDHAEFAMASGEMSDEEFIAFIAGWMSLAAQHLVDGGLLASFIDWRSVEATLSVGRNLGFELLNLVVWAKTNAGMGSLWRSAHEMLPVFKVGDSPHINNVELGKHGRWRSNVWQAAGASSLGSDAREGLKLHPTVKPVVLLEEALLDVTHRGDAVLDPFVGSGSLLVAAENSGRRGYGIELDERYVDVAVRRWQNHTGRQAVLSDTGETFAQVGARRARGDEPPLKRLPKPRLRIAAGSGSAVRP